MAKAVDIATGELLSIASPGQGSLLISLIWFGFFSSYIPAITAGIKNPSIFSHNLLPVSKFCYVVLCMHELIKPRSTEPPLYHYSN